VSVPNAYAGGVVRSLAVIAFALVACGEGTRQQPAPSPPQASGHGAGRCASGPIPFELDPSGFPVPAGRLGNGMKNSGSVNWPMEQIIAETHDPALRAGWSLEERMQRDTSRSFWARSYGKRLLVMYHSMRRCETTVTVVPWQF